MRTSCGKSWTHLSFRPPHQMGVRLTLEHREPTWTLEGWKESEKIFLYGGNNHLLLLQRKINKQKLLQLLQYQ